MFIIDNPELIISLLQLLVTGYLSFKVYQMSKNDLHPPSFLILDVSIREIETEDEKKFTIYKIYLLNNGPGSATVLDLGNLDIRKGGFNSDIKTEIPPSVTQPLPRRVRQGDFISASFISEEKISPDYTRVNVETKEFGDLTAAYFPEKHDWLISRKTRAQLYLRTAKPRLQHKLKSVKNR